MLRTLIINLFALMVSFIIAYLYQVNTNIQILISENIIVLLFVFVISSISLYLYDHDNTYNKKPKNKFSLSIFKIKGLLLIFFERIFLFLHKSKSSYALKQTAGILFPVS